MNGSVTTFAFDPIQSLLALATSTGEIHIYGKQQVEVVFTLDSKATIKSIRFVKGVYLVAADSKDVVLIFSLHTKKLLTAFYAPGKITCIDTDPSLDWMLIGLQSGAVIIYDIDRDNLSPIKIENLQKKRFFPQAVLSPVVSIQWNPRDIGSVLISYERVTVVYSLVDNQIKQHFIYELPPFAPGGDPSVRLDTKRNPKVVQSLYHPNSLHILTVHEDNSLVFWDANNGQLIQARTLFDTDVNVPKKFNDPSPVRNSQIFKVLWICQANPEYTSLLIAGGSSDPENGCHNLTTVSYTHLDVYKRQLHPHCRQRRPLHHPHQQSLLHLQPPPHHPLLPIIKEALSPVLLTVRRFSQIIILPLRTHHQQPLIQAINPKVRVFLKKIETSSLVVWLVLVYH